MKSNSIWINALAVMLVFGFTGTNIATAQGIFDQTADWGTDEFPPQLGDFKVPGSVSFSDGTYTIEGNGNDIWAESDEGFYVYTSAEGSMTLTGRVSWVDPGANEWAKLSTMVRENGADPASKNYMAHLRGGLDSVGDRSDASWRQETGGSSSSFQVFTDEAGESPLTQNEEGFLWHRVSYDTEANVGVYEYSLDGNSFSVGHVHSIDMGDNPAYGFAITNHVDDETLAVGEVDQVELTEFEGGVFGRRSISHDGHFNVQTLYDNGDEIAVTLNLTNTTDSPQTVTVQESAPEGWSASDISNDGSAEGNLISWDVEVPAGEMSLSYTVTAPADSEGTASFSGSVGEYDIMTGDGNDLTLNKIGDPISIFDSQTDIGAVAASGQAVDQGDFITVEGSGADIWGTADEFYYVFSEVEGSFSLSATMFLFPAGGDATWTKGGFMVRDELTAGATNGFGMMRSDGDVRLQFRDATGGESSNTTAVENSDFTFETFELVRLGETVQFFGFDADGNKTLLGSQNIPMDGTDFAGLAITSHNDGSFSAADFENIEFNQLDGFAERTVNSNLIPDAGGLMEGFTVTVMLDEGKTSSSTVVEELPDGFTPVNIETSNGSASVSGNQLTWSLDGASGEATMTYDLEVTGAASTQSAEITGFFETGGQQITTTGNGDLVPASFVALEIPFSESAPTLDGVIAEGEYSTAFTDTFANEEGDIEAPGVHILGDTHSPDEQNTTFHAFHDNQFIYVGVDVVDPALDFSSGTNAEGVVEVWRNDSVELYLDGNLSRSTTKENGSLGAQMTVAGDGSLVGGNSAPGTTIELDNGALASDTPDNFWNFAARAKDDGSGFVVEYQIDKLQTLSPISRRLVGFDLLMNVGNGSGDRVAKYGYWNEPIDGNTLNEDGTITDFWDNETGWAFAQLTGGVTNVTGWSLY